MKQYFIVGGSTVYGVGGEEGGWADMLKRHMHKQMYGQNGIGDEIEIYNFSKPGVSSQFLLDTYPEQTKHYGRDGEITTIVSVGMNNAKASGEPDNFICTLEDYEQQLRQLFNMFEAHSHEVICVGFHFIDETKTHPRISSVNGTRTYYSNARIAKFQAVTNVVCGDVGAKLVKISIPKQEWISEYLYSDGLHPNKRGYEEIFNKILVAL